MIEVRDHSSRDLVAHYNVYRISETRDTINGEDRHFEHFDGTVRHPWGIVQVYGTQRNHSGEQDWSFEARIAGNVHWRHIRISSSSKFWSRRGAARKAAQWFEALHNR